MRPKDVEILPAAQRWSAANGVDVHEVREARAVGQPLWEGTDLDAGWLVVLGPPRADGRRLRMLCGQKDLSQVADVRLVEEGFGGEQAAATGGH